MDFPKQPEKGSDTLFVPFLAVKPKKLKAITVTAFGAKLPRTGIKLPRKTVGIRWAK